MLSTAPEMQRLIEGLAAAHGFDLTCPGAELRLYPGEGYVPPPPFGDMPACYRPLDSTQAQGDAPVLRIRVVTVGAVNLAQCREEDGELIAADPEVCFAIRPRGWKQCWEEGRWVPCGDAERWRPWGVIWQPDRTYNRYDAAAHTLEAQGELTAYCERWAQALTSVAGTYTGVQTMHPFDSMPAVLQLRAAGFIVELDFEEPISVSVALPPCMTRYMAEQGVGTPTTHRAATLAEALAAALIERAEFAQIALRCAEAGEVEQLRRKLQGKQRWP